MDYVRNEIPFVNYVRDRKGADVHILFTGEEIASGGFKATAFFIGQHTFEGKNDTLSFIGYPSMTQNKMAQEGVRILRIGLLPYLNKLTVAKNLDVVFSGATQDIVATEESDPWNNWVFSVRGNLFANGEQSYKSLNAFGGFSVGRVTEDWKFKTSFNGNKNEQIYIYDTHDIDSLTSDTTIYEQRDVYTTKNRGVHSHLVRSLGNYFSVGIWSGVYSSTYENKNLEAYFSPKIEYNFFPYSESTRKQWRFEYGIGGKFADYADTTIYDKTEEWLSGQSFKTTLALIQPWGSISSDISFHHYFHDFSLNQTDISSNLSFRLLKGLNLNLSGYLGLVHNQVALPKGDVSKEKLLLKQSAQETNYTYFFSVGFSYTFGSIYNNIVNPRFGSGGNGQQRITYSN